VDALSGRVVWQRRSRFNVKEMYRFFYYVQKQYPQAKVIYMALDTWPIHFHAMCRNTWLVWRSPIGYASYPLPTYAPWTNPTEKYWLKLSREWLRFHPFAGDKLSFKF
jgi:transposase